MRVLASTQFYPPSSRVGAWLSTHRCLAELVKRGHEVTVVSQFGRGDGYTLDGVGVIEAGSRAAARQAIRHLTPAVDVFVSHLGDQIDAHRHPASAGVPTVCMGHGGPIKPGGLDGASLVVWNSRSYAAQAAWTGPAIVVHPPVDPAEYATERGDAVTLVNLSAEKGVDTFSAIAERMPGTPFLGVCGSHGIQQYPEGPNVEVIPPVRDMRDVYRRTRVLIMPSERETWGRVAVEAMASGIPVIAHPTPGLQEALGDAGLFCDRDNTGEWVAALRALEDPELYADASSRALRRSAELDPAPDLARFADAVEALCSS